MNGRCLRTILGLFSLILLLAFGAEPAAAAGAGNQPPVARARAPKGVGIGALQLASVTLDGSLSFDPDNDPITFEWRDANGNVIGNTSNIVRLLPLGVHRFTLTVTDTLFTTGSDTVTVLVQLDTTQPFVIPPDDLAVSVTENGGARGSASGKLAPFLTGASAVDDFDHFPTMLPPQVGGNDADNNTLFPAGVTTVTFRFSDNAGNIGTATANVTVVDLQDDDLFVGAADSIQKVRGTTVTTFCASVPNDPLSWDTADEVLVDSQGRVTFLAFLSFNPATFGPLRRFGLFRCDFEGATPQLLAVFGTGADQPRPTEPVPFPGELFTRFSGLHLSRLRSIVIDDSVNGGRPKRSTDDAYVFSAHNFPDIISFANGILGPPNTRRYRVSSGMWEKSPESPNIITQQFPCIFCSTNPGIPAISPDLVYHQGATYSAVGGAIGKDADGFRFEVHAKIAGLTVRLGVVLFGGYHQFDGFYDDQRYSNTAASNCPPPPPFSIDPKTGQLQSVRDFVPVNPGGALQGFGSINQVIFDEYGSFGLAVTDDFGGASPFLVNISEKYLDNAGDLSQYFRVCPPQVLVPVLDATSILDFFDPNSPTGTGLDRLTSAPSGLRGTQRGALGGTVVSISSAGVKPIVSGLTGASGIAAWPPGVSPGTGIVVVIRVDSPVDVLLTDANGKRLGVDATGQAVNDFGSDGFDSGAGTHPRFYAIQNPAPGNFALSSIATGTGPFTVHVYTADLSKPLGEHIFTSGTVSPGDMGKHDFTLDAAGALSFSNQLPIANAGTDQTVNADASGNATVALDGSLSSDPDGDPLGFIWSGPFGSLTGAQVNATLPVGVHVLKLTVDDGQGGMADDTVIVTVDAPAGQPPSNQAPAANAGPDQTVEATSPGGASVTLNGAGSSDPDGDALTVTWTGPFGTASGQNPTVSLPLGAHTITLIVDDGKGGTATDTVQITVQDTQPPLIHCGSPDGAWHPTNAVIACTAADGVSGLANAADASFNLSTNVPAGIETPNAATNSRIVCDPVGNCATAGPVAGNKVDKKGPDITINAPASTYLLNQDVAASYSCSDGGSGLASCSGPVASGSNFDTAAVGTKSFTVNAADEVGNTTNRTVSYAVTYNICLLYDPTKAKKSGSTFPIKLQPCKASGVNMSSSELVVTATHVTRMSDDAPAPLEDSGSANPDSNFRFDPTLGGTGGYIFNFSSNGFATGTYRLIFKVSGDPMEHSVNFQVK